MRKFLVGKKIIINSIYDVYIVLKFRILYIQNLDCEFS